MRSSTSPLGNILSKRDFYAGGLMVLIGLGIALKGVTYHLGTLMHMGPGFFPTSLGVLLVLIGIAIVASAKSTSDDGVEEDQRLLPENPQWWAWFCILMGPVLFILLGSYFGMIPGTFACVFVAALGDRNATWKGTLILSTVVTVFGVVLFAYFLQVPMPILTWGSGL